MSVLYAVLGGLIGSLPGLAVMAWATRRYRRLIREVEARRGQQ